MSSRRDFFRLTAGAAAGAFIAGTAGYTFGQTPPPRRQVSI